MLKQPGPHREGGFDHEKKLSDNNDCRDGGPLEYAGAEPCVRAGGAQRQQINPSGVGGSGRGGGGNDHGLPTTGRPEASRKRCPPGSHTFPATSPPTRSQRSAKQQVRFTLFKGMTSFTYTVTVSSTGGRLSVLRYALRDGDRMNHTVGGDTTVTVEMDAPEPEPEPTPGDEQAQDPSASRSFSPASVAAGGRVVVTITATTGTDRPAGSHGDAALRVRIRFQRPRSLPGYRDRAGGQVHPARG